MINLFVKLLIGDLFTFGDRPERKLMKTGHSEFTGSDGTHQINPHVAVIHDRSEGLLTSRGLLDRMKGTSDER